MPPFTSVFIMSVILWVSSKPGHVNGLNCEDCTALPLCLNFTLADTTCGRSLQSNGLSLGYIAIIDKSESLVQFRIAPNISIYMLSGTLTYAGYLVQEVCDGTEMINPGQFIDENVTSCTTQIQPSNAITLNCGVEVSLNPEGYGIFVSNRPQTDFPNNIYIIRYTSCTCGMGESREMGEVNAFWDECNEVDTSTVQPIQSAECLRQRCLFKEETTYRQRSIYWNFTKLPTVDSFSRFFNKACSCCSIHCDSDPYYSVHASDVCPNNNCSNTSLCETGCSLECDGRHREFCEHVCNHPFQNISSSLNITEMVRYCADRISQNCSADVLPDIDCNRSSHQCNRICQRDGVVRFFAEACPSTVFQFCDSYTDYLLQSSEFTEDILTLYIGIVRSFVEDEIPYALVRKLEPLFDLKSIEGDLLTLHGHAEMLLDVYNALFDDALTSSWYSSDKAAFKVLLQLERLAELIGIDIANGRRAVPLILKKDSLFFSVSAPNRTEAVNNTHRVTMEGDGGLDEFSADVQISLDVLCPEKEERCSSAVAVFVANNLAEYLHNALNQSNDYAGYNLGTELLSAQVFGVQNLDMVLAKSPVEITFTLQHANLTKENVECVFWNHSLNSWSNNSVCTEIINNKTTVKCTSHHLTSFAVLVNLNPFSNNGTEAERKALRAVSYIGLTVSILSLLATIICLIIFRKILNKGPLLYVHLNLAVALLLGYIFFVVGVDTGARMIEPLCIVLAALMQYFFLASFCWMLCEGIMLYLLVVRVFGNAAQRWYWLLIVGWALPFPIVMISAAVLQKEYIHSNYCWLNAGPHKAAIWTFVVPMLIVILINTVILVMTVISIVRGRKHGGAETVVKARTLVITAIRGTIVLLPLLGITWVIGLFAVNENTTVFAWLFVLINSFQGLFIFFLHVLRNKAFLRKIKQTCFTREEKKTVLTSSTMMSTKQGIETSTLDYNSRSIAPSISESPSDKKKDLSLTVMIETGSDVL